MMPHFGLLMNFNESIRDFYEHLIMFANYDFHGHKSAAKSGSVLLL